MNNNFWKGKRVLVTGHTGFKGGWLCLWLQKMGAHVTGYALNPPTKPSLFDIAAVGESMESVIGNVCDFSLVSKCITDCEPEIIIHLAAQSLVRASYANPVETYSTNVMGTINLLEAVRENGKAKVLLVVTSDKCYENKEWNWGYRENDSLGGYDPYSNSKACAELVTSAYRNSYFKALEHILAIATARAGNVIGGGDWAEDRLVSDCIRALLAGDKIIVRSPQAIRPWQHVLEPLSGYLCLSEKMYEDSKGFSESWNFGPDDKDAREVSWLVERICSEWGEGTKYEIDTKEKPHEANYLKLDCSKAIRRLNWHPRWNLEKAIDATIKWTKAYRDGLNMREICMKQIDEYMAIKS